MRKALCWLSFDFDETVTTNHTWKEAKLTKDTAANVSKAPSVVTLANPVLLAKLINIVCSRKLIFCFTSMQFSSIVHAVLAANPELKACMDRYLGTYFFIQGRNEVHAAGGKKARALQQWFSVTEEYSGIHFDDDGREANGFEQLGIAFQLMSGHGSGFGSGVDSDLIQAFRDINRYGFTHVGTPKTLPDTTYGNQITIPTGHHFGFQTRRSAAMSIGGVTSDILVALMTP